MVKSSIISGTDSPAKSGTSQPILQFVNISSFNDEAKTIERKINHGFFLKEDFKDLAGSMSLTSKVGMNLITVNKDGILVSKKTDKALEMGIYRFKMNTNSEIWATKNYDFEMAADKEYLTWGTIAVTDGGHIEHVTNRVVFVDDISLARFNTIEYNPAFNYHKGKEQIKKLKEDSLSFQKSINIIEEIRNPTKSLTSIELKKLMIELNNSYDKLPIQSEERRILKENLRYKESFEDIIHDLNWKRIDHDKYTKRYKEDLDKRLILLEDLQEKIKSKTKKLASPNIDPFLDEIARARAAHGGVFEGMLTVKIWDSDNPSKYIENIKKYTEKDGRYVIVHEDHAKEIVSKTYSKGVNSPFVVVEHYQNGKPISIEKKYHGHALSKIEIKDGKLLKSIYIESNVLQKYITSNLENHSDDIIEKREKWLSNNSWFEKYGNRSPKKENRPDYFKKREPDTPRFGGEPNSSRPDKLSDYPDYGTRPSVKKSDVPPLKLPVGFEVVPNKPNKKGFTQMLACFFRKLCGSIK